jgi:hypothetical protein
LTPLSEYCALDPRSVCSCPSLQVALFPLERERERERERKSKPVYSLEEIKVALVALGGENGKTLNKNAIKKKKKRKAF